MYAQISETEIKAAYIERFTRFIEWPTSTENNATKKSFKITVLGDNTFGSSLDNLFKDLKVKELPVILKYTRNYTEVLGSDIVIICNSERKKLQEILQFIGSEPMLIISDSEGFAQMGTCINMYIDGNNIRYEINQKTIKKSGLNVSSLLLASAKIINADD
ncbi:MAG: YfiR family protein [Labilibaculum sp.]|nr:YfiR family protein [Labilibaculum sp.]MBI9058894.1 YfiR family protein [Labilibaculum sp.]